MYGSNEILPRQRKPRLRRQETRTAHAGGSFTDVLDELVEVGFVERYAPLTVANPRTSHAARYAIADEYLHFYYRFIENKIGAIDAGKFVSNPSAGLQIDLMYIRKDSKIILCEIKYNSDAPVNCKVIKEVQEKLDRFITNNPRYRRYTLETALITAEDLLRAQ